MKKLMIVAAVALLAGMSQAAQIKWGNGTSSKLVGLDGTTAITAANATAWGLTLTLMHADGTATPSTQSSINSMSAGVMSTSTWNYTYGTDASNGDEFYIHAIMTVDKKEYEMDIGKDSPFAISAVNNTGTDTFTWAAGSYGGSMWKETAAVPEPTSGLLMLLGMAGLALRRRRA